MHVNENSKINLKILIEMECNRINSKVLVTKMIF